MRPFRYLSLICVLWFSACGVAQIGLTPRPPAAPEYVLGPGDQVVVHVIDLEEIPDRPIRIDSGGFVDMPYAGRFRASGLTVEQFKSELASRLSKYINNPQISVVLTDDQSRSVSVVGALNSPGMHQLSGSKRLLDVLSLSGGARSDAGSRVIITREQKWGKLPLPGARVDPATGTSTASVSLDDLQASLNPAENILIAPNDIISIPKAEVVYVLGDVSKSGGFELHTHPTLSILKAIALAGGMDHNADAKDARIVREAHGSDGNPIEIPVNVQKIVDGKATDVPLQANDVLYIPHSSGKAGAKIAAGAILSAATGLAIYRF